MATTESERSVPNGRHTHQFSPAPDTGSITTTMLAASVYGGTPASIDPDDAGVAGSATTVSRSDHQHQATCNAPAALTKTATSAESAGTGLARDSHVHATDALPWGVVAYQELTSSSSAYTNGQTTDFALSSVVVDAARLYKVHLHSQITDGVNAGDWSVNLHVGGTATLRFDRDDSLGANADRTISSSVLWRPSSGTVNLDVRVVENIGTPGTTITFAAAAAVPRQFWVEDIGPR